MPVETAKNSSLGWAAHTVKHASESAQIAINWYNASWTYYTSRKETSMKIAFYPVLLLLVFAMIGCQQQVTPVAKSPDATGVDKPQQTDSDSAGQGDTPKAESKEFIIDVRSQEEWDSGHLRDAVLIPHTEIAERIGEVTEDKSAKLVLY